MRSIKHFINNYARRAEDTKDESFSKLLILAIATSCCIFGLIWSTIYFSVFGFGLTMILPFSFVVIVGIAIYVSHRVSDHRILIFAQLTCITWISALIQWSIGSMEHSSLVIAWSFLEPLGALIFLSVRQAVVWMAMFIGIVVVSAVFNPALLGYQLVVSDQTRTIFYIMNIGTSAIVVFAASAWFVKTIQIERNRSENLLEKIQSLFGQHVSREVADELISDDADNSESKYYDVTIMFLDIRDFTVLADSRAPKEVANFQNIVFSELINVVRQNGGIVLQILGDGIMAVFGAPLVSETHAVDAVKAGFSMINRSKALSDNGEIPAITLGIGLHSGKVIAGEVGNEYRKFYSLAGSNVIVASRIEQLNKKFKSQFLISETVNNNIQHLDYSPSFLGEEELKGISKHIGIYKLV